MVEGERGRDEWLEPDGLGGFASGTVSGIRTRRYHALLLTATTPPSGRVVLVNGFEAWLETPGGTCALTSQRYAPDVIHPDGAQRIEAFEPDPWPSWVLALPGGGQIEHGLLVQSGRSVVTLSWRLRGAAGGTLAVRPLISGRDYHALHHENPAFRFDAEADGDRVVWRPYPGSAGDRRVLERPLHPRARLVSELPLHRGARPRARSRRGPGVARRLPLGPVARRGRAHARCRGTRAAQGPGDGARRRAPAPPALRVAPAPVGRRVCRPARHREDDHRRLPVVHRLGA